MGRWILLQTVSYSNSFGIPAETDNILKQLFRANCNSIYSTKEYIANMGNYDYSSMI